MEKKDIVQEVKEDKVMFDDEKQLLYSNNLGLEMKRKLINVVFVVLLFVDQKQGP